MGKVVIIQNRLIETVMGADWLLVDVMDGLFVPSISFGQPVVKSLRPASDLFFDVHMMVQDPGRYVEDFHKAGADGITVHAEACTHLDRTLEMIRERGIRFAAGVAWEEQQWLMQVLLANPSVQITDCGFYVYNVGDHPSLSTKVTAKHLMDAIDAIYAAIGELLKGEPRNVITVEDPIEYEIPGVAQAEVDSSDKVNFSKALKSILRHDPDVVMIGEIRDAESLDVAVKSALTGHLVLSTLHTNDAIGSVTRLRNMGLANHLIAAPLRLSIAQRLVRRRCAACGGAGCPACSGRGFSGRIGVFELFLPDATAAQRIADGASAAEIFVAARAAGFVTLAEDARAKVAAGLTTEPEILRVID